MYYYILRFSRSFSFPPATADTSSFCYPCIAEYGAPVIPNSVLGGYPGMQELTKCHE